jgi:hypothetical protein
MDPNLLSVILAVAANGLTALIAHLGHKSKEFIIGKDFLEKWELEKTALQPILQNVPHDVAENMQWQGPPSLEETYAFLHTPEVEAIVRQIYSMKFSVDKKRSGLEPIRKEFLASFSLYTGFEKNQLAESAKLLFDTLLAGCDLALTSAIDKGILSAHEAKSAFRHRMILDELATIKKNLALLTARRKPNIQEILVFEEKYRQQVASRHGYITPPYFDAARKLPIDSLYVNPNFVTTPKKNEKPEVLKMSDFLSGIYRAVLLGNPGGGKSTFVLKLCYDLATHYSERLFGGRKQVTPILVVLRDYGAEKKIRNCSILQFIETKANANYQVQPPPGAFDYLLLNGRAVVIFDGLDELLDTSYRQEISSDVEVFCTLYPSVPVLVTSREVGYEQAPLDEKRFEILRLASLDEGQVKEYVMKWFAVDPDLTLEQQQQKAQDFLKESRVVPDLRSNPLMLALMCNIYRGENYIPKNRPDVYDKCATMLFERWDKSRGIHVPLPFEAHISPAMKYLAHWIYSDEELRGGVTERRLIGKATEYLCPRRFEDREEAEKAAREFIEFCRGRAWVFTDTGTTKEGERLYQFTHQTFLEYFSAAYLVRTNPTPGTLIAVLQPRIAKREWDVVAQLAFQLQNKNLEGAGDELLTTLIKQAYEIENDERWNLLSFAVRCLEFIVPSPNVTREIAKVCFEYSLARSLIPVKKEKPSRGEIESSVHSEIGGILQDLLYAATENRITIADSLEKLLVERINFGSEAEALKVLGVGLYLPLFYIRRSGIPQNEGLDFWRRVSDCIFDSCANRIEILCPKHFWICCNAFWRGKVGIADLIKWYGVENLFHNIPFTIFLDLRIHWMSLAWELIQDVLSALYSEQMDEIVHRKLVNCFDVLKEVGHILISCPLPWSRLHEQDLTMLPFPIRRLTEVDERWSREPREVLNLDSDTLFGAFVLFAAFFESNRLVARGKLERSSNDIEALIKVIKTSHHRFFDFIRWTYLARFEQVETDKVQAEMDRCGFTTEQQDFAWRWVRREIDLLPLETAEASQSDEDQVDE